MPSSAIAWSMNPEDIAVRCPQCGSKARFRFAIYKIAQTQADADWFRASKDFEVERIFLDGYKHKVSFFPGLRGNHPSDVAGCPEGYSDGYIENSAMVPGGGRSSAGTVICPACGLRRKHTLNWPSDAFFTVDYRGHVLWAFNRSHAAALLDYIRSEDRSLSGRDWQDSLKKIPAPFKSKKARDTVVKKLEGILRPD